MGGVGDGSTGASTEGVSFETSYSHFVGARLGGYTVFTSEEAPRGVEESTLNFTHWGRGPMETGVYMLGTFQSLAESTSNVTARYISFTFQM